MTNERLEAKLGFNKVREIIAEKCRTDYAAARVAEERFSTSPGAIRKRLALTDEMRLILLFEENFPLPASSTAPPSWSRSRARGAALTPSALANSAHCLTP
ncbi:MAG: hypothetical protein J6X82_04525 [Bacteroidales bacterium]|nr:hypothetical protein [Bacteroidales bacterium]